MSNQLTLNTASLEELKARVNALPEPEIMQDGKTATPTEATQTIVPDSGFGGLSSVTVNPIPDNYITTDDATAAAGDILSGKTAYVDGAKVTGTIATKTASNLTASGATVTVPAGYYASQTTKSVATATQATPSISVSSAGLITASATQSAGYVSAGTKSATKQLTVQAAKTITPSTSAQTAVASGRYTTGAVTVAAIPSGSVGDPSISVNSSGLITATTAVDAGYVDGTDKTGTKQLTVQAAKTVTPTKSSQTAVASGRYTTGAVTVAAIPDKYEDRTESLPQLNTVNGGTAATTIANAVDNTETLVEDEDALITQLQTKLEGMTYDSSNLQKKVIQPMVYDQIITADGAYQALSQVTVKGDANLNRENIVSGVSIFGVPGGAYPIHYVHEVETVDTTTFDYSVNAISGASYGFAVNSNGYWQSGNKGVNNSYAICRVAFEVKRNCNITFDVINYAETNYDFGLFGKLDTALGLSYDVDNSSLLQKSFKGESSSSVKQVVYTNVSTGSHFIDVKFRKDSSQHSNNDTLQFKVITEGSVETTEVKYIPEESAQLIQSIEQNLVSENIKSGVSILGVPGSYEGTGGGGNSFETCPVTLKVTGGSVSAFATCVENSELKFRAWYEGIDETFDAVIGSVIIVFTNEEPGIGGTDGLSLYEITEVQTNAYHDSGTKYAATFLLIDPYNNWAPFPAGTPITINIGLSLENS